MYISATTISMQIVLQVLYNTDLVSSRSLWGFSLIASHHYESLVVSQQSCVEYRTEHCNLHQCISLLLRNNDRSVGNVSRWRYPFEKYVSIQRTIMVWVAFSANSRSCLEFIIGILATRSYVLVLVFIVLKYL